jgi:hypothetical protein
MPTKWLQERAKGSKNGHGMPPHRAFCGTVRAATLPGAPPRSEIRFGFGVHREGSTKQSDKLSCVGLDFRHARVLFQSAALVRWHACAILIEPVNPNNQQINLP